MERSFCYERKKKYCSLCGSSRKYCSFSEDYNENYLYKVESYDVLSDKWSSMPNMINSHSYHSLVIVKDKLIVIGRRRDICELFDNVCKVFIAFKPCFTDYFLRNAMSIGNRTVVLQGIR